LPIDIVSQTTRLLALRVDQLRITPS